MIRVLGPLLVLLLIPVIAGADEIEAEAREIEVLLIAPCCGRQSIAQHYSSESLEMRAEVRELLREGRTRQEILDHFVERYGEQILAVPEASGFNLAIYVVPALFLVLGVVGVAWLARRWQRQGRSAQIPQPRVELNEEDARRLQEALRELD